MPPAEWYGIFGYRPSPANQAPGRGTSQIIELLQPVRMALPAGLSFDELRDLAGFPDYYAREGRFRADD